MKTCNECEHYEFYNGPKKNSGGNKSIMYCAEFGGGYYSANLSVCSSFTPKKPVGKSCKTCGARMENNGTGKACDGFLDVPIGNCTNYSNWIPIKPDKPTCKHTGAVITKRLSERCNSCTGIENCQSCRKCKHCESLDSGNDVSDRDYVMYCSDQKAYMTNSLGTCTEFKPDKPKAEVLENQETKKEKTMSRMKKLIRKYVMGCTLYCTAVICIALNPYVCKFWYWIVPLPEDKTFSNATMADKGVCWFYTILLITTIFIAIYAFNKATDFIFGKLEK